MTRTPTTDAAPTVPASALGWFLALTFGITWGILALFLGFQEAIEGLFGPPSGSHPLFVLAVYSPAIAAIALVAFHGGWVATRALLRRVTLWRASPGWYLGIFVGVPALFLTGAAWKGTLFEEPLPFDDLRSALAAIAFMLLLGPVEEIGWRGFAQPLVQRRLAPLWAGLAVGAVWGVWHLPAFFLDGTPQSAWGFAPFFGGTIALAVIATGLLNRSGGSILLPMLFHFQVNNPLFPDAAPYDSLLFVGVAVLLVVVHRDWMLRPGAGVTLIAPGGSAPTARPVASAL